MKSYFRKIKNYLRWMLMQMWFYTVRHPYKGMYIWVSPEMEHYIKTHSDGIEYLDTLLSQFREKIILEWLKNETENK